jgi:hypothetical protein
MTDIRKVKFVPLDDEPRWGWVNFERLLYAEDHAWDEEEQCPVALLVMDYDDSGCGNPISFMRVDARCLDNRKRGNREATVSSSVHRSVHDGECCGAANQGDFPVGRLRDTIYS